MTLSEWLDQWLENMADALRSNTLRNYRSYIENHIRPDLGDKPLARITPKDVQWFYEKLNGNLASGTVRRIHTTLHGALKAAQQTHLIVSNPTETITAPKFSYRPKQILTDEQLDTFMKVIAEDEVWHNFFYTELTTGLRRGEICGLKWDDFDEISGTLKVRRTVYRETDGSLTVGDTKTSAGTRKIVLPSSTAEILSKRKASALTEWIFPNPLKPEQPADPNSAYRRLKVLLKQAGLPNIRFHDLRHTFSTVSLEHGMDIKTLSTIIGHVSSSTTLNVYAHVTDEMRRTAAVKIDQGIGRAAPQTEAVTAPQKPAPSTFQAHKGQRRKPGTGCISQINECLWEGRYSPIWPDGKKHARNIYAHSEEECETLLAEMILEMKAEISTAAVFIRSFAKEA